MLTAKQEEFATGIACGLSQADAYRRAYPKSLKWADATVWKRASELAADGEVSGRVKELLKNAAAANEVTVERIVKELARIAFGSKRNVMRWGPNGLKLKESDDLTDDDAALVAEVKETVTATGGTLSLKTHDKVKALELLGKHVGMFADKVELTGKDGAPLAPAGLSHFYGGK
jgi:phage terminase small subunit